jgi:hypothetical protein
MFCFIFSLMTGVASFDTFCTAVNVGHPIWEHWKPVMNEGKFVRSWGCYIREKREKLKIDAASTDAMWDFKFSWQRVWCSELSSGLYCRVKWWSAIILHGSITQKTALSTDAVVKSSVNVSPHILMHIAHFNTHKQGFEWHTVSFVCEHFRNPRAFC